MKKYFMKNFDGIGEFDPHAMYEERKKNLKIKIERWKEGNKVEVTPALIKKVNLHEQNVFDWTVADMKQVDKLNKKVAIILPTHLGHRFWIKACLESCKKTEHFIMLVYDNPFWKVKENSRAFPSSQVMALADSVVIKHRTYRGAVGICHYWNMIYGLKVLKGLGFTHAFAMNGDCVLEKPENFEKIIEMLGDNDLFPCQYHPEQRYCGTMGWIGKVDLMLDFFLKYLEELFVYSRTTEGRLGYYVVENNVKLTIPENSERNFKLPSGGTWYDLLGFRHIHAEHKVRRWEKLEPVERKYYDFGPEGSPLSGEYKLLMDYWENGNKESLKAWWGK